MKVTQQFVIALVLSVLSPAYPARVATSPIGKVVSLIMELKGKIEADGKKEQKSFDKFACWCEKTLGEKGEAIDDAKKKIDLLISLILKLSGEIGVSMADVNDNMKPGIAADIQAQAEAQEVREKEHTEFEADKGEAEQCLGALEAAINALSGTGKTGFLGTLQESQLLGVTGGLKIMLQKSTLVDGKGELIVPEHDLEIVRQFVDQPQHFLHPQGGMLAALQLDNNPFGDYAPKSGQIQGILKDMYDQFAMKLERASGEEAEKRKAFEKLMATKQQEIDMLKDAVVQATTAASALPMQKADAQAELDALKAQLKADEKLFGEVKDACREKAVEWATITRMHTEELQGMDKAIEILNSPEAQQTFQAASTTLVQLSPGSRSVLDGSGKDEAYARLRSLASRYGNLGLAQIAANMKTGGSFDKIIAMIDKLIERLRAEEKDDVEHRDRCQAGKAKNKSDMEDLSHEIEKAKENIEILQNKQTEAQQKLNALLSEIEATKAALVDLLDLRNEERRAFEKALKDDANAVEIIGKAIQALAAFYKSNKIPLQLFQEGAQVYSVDPQPAGPEYSVADQMPETSFSGEYKASSGASGGIIAILSMLREDFQKEMKTGRADDVKAQKKYEQSKRAMQSALVAQKESKVALEKQLAEMLSKMTKLNALVDLKNADLGQAQKMSTALDDDCAWVETHFDSRREKRQKEIDGLVEAKGILAGAQVAPETAAAVASGTAA